MSPSTVELVLQDGQRRELDSSLWRLWLRSDPEDGVAIATRVDPKAKVAWRELDKMKELVELDYQGTDAGVVAYVTRRKRLRTFRWTGHGQARIDLARSALTELSLDAKKPLVVRIPPKLTTLRLLDVEAWSKLRVETDDGGARLAIWIWAPRKRVRAIAGLARLGALSIGAVREVDLGLVAKHPALQSLEIFGDDSGVAIANVAKLASLRSLASVSITNAYHTDFTRFPGPEAMPSLGSLAIDGVREEAARVLREKWQRSKVLSLRGVRSDAWLRANADNPFRAWAEEHDAALGARATKAYEKAAAALEGTTAKKEIEAALRAFVVAFNPIEARIDTIQREEIGDAFADLAERARIPAAQAQRWFDAWRDF